METSKNPFEMLVSELRSAAGDSPYSDDADWTEELFARAADALEFGAYYRRNHDKS